MRGGKRKGAGRPAKAPTVPLSCRVTEPVAAEVDRAAESKGLSRNAFLCAMLERWAKRRGVDTSSHGEPPVQ